MFVWFEKYSSLFSSKVNERLKLENKSSADGEDDEYECYVCNANLYVSLVRFSLPSHQLSYTYLTYRLPTKMKK